MAFCTNCGSKIADNAKFCTSCGFSFSVDETATVAQQKAELSDAATDACAVVEETQLQSTAPQQPTVVAAPTAAPITTPYTEEPISIGGYMGMFLLLLIPIVNFVLLIVWACGGSKKRNKVNLARAILLWGVICAVLLGIIVIIFAVLFGDQIRELTSGFGSIFGSY